MKKLLLITPLLFWTSCHEQEIFEKQSTLQENFKITASMEDLSNSRTVFEGEASDGKRRVLWQQNDALSVFMGSADEKSKFTLASGDGTAFASFQGNVHIWGGVEDEDVAGFANVAYYPYTENVIVTYDADEESYALSTTFPAEQPYASNASFAQNVSPMVAATKNKGSYAFMFKNIASWVNLYVKGSAKITKVVMKAANDDIAGDYIVTVKNGIDPIATINENGTSVKEITIDCGENGIQLSKDEATIFTFTTIPFEFDANEVSFDIYGEGVYMKDAYIIKKAGSFLRSNFHGISQNSPIEFLPNSIVEGETVQAILKGKGYPTIPDAIAAAEENDVITVLEGEFDLASQLNTVSGQPSKTVTIKGAGIDKTNLKGAKNPYNNNNSPGNYANGLTLKFEDLTFTTVNEGYQGGFGHAASVEFTDCKIVGQFYAHSNAPHKFVGCTIDPLNGYLYTYASNCDFEGCTFTASEGKALQVYAEAAGEFTTNITNCTFTAAKQATTWDGKPVTGIDVNSANGAKMRVNIDNCTTTGFPTGLNSGSDLWNVKNTTADIIVNVDEVKVWPITHYEEDANGNVVVYTGQGLKEALTQAGAAGAGNTTIKLNGNLDMAGIEWTPIKVDGYNGADIVTIEGNNAIITGLKAPLFQGGFAGGSGIVIKDLTIDQSNITSTNTLGSGAFVECSDSQDKIYLENCHLKNSTVKGSRTGGLVGWTTGYSNTNDGPVKSYITFKGCSVVNCTIEGSSSVGGLNGHAGASDWTYTTIENCIVTGCTFKSTDDSDWRVGVAVGTANVGEVTIKNLTESGNTITQTGKTAPVGEKRNYFGRLVPGSTGKLVIDDAQYITSNPQLAACLTADEQNISVVLVNDVDLPISSLGEQTGGSGEYKLGSASTENINIDLNGKKLNITTTYWSAIGAKNDNATITIKNGTMTSSQATGTWNSYDVTFANCNYVIEDVDFLKSIAFTNAGKKVDLINVDINETHDYYALWISAAAQTVNIDGGKITSAGRGIKIDDEYVNDATALVNLTVENYTFETAKKAAIMVKSPKGADITLSNVNINNVAADKVNAVWCDADAVQYTNLISVSGGTKINEP